jgi:UDP-N-acetylglucosamine 2-epimerase
MAAVRMSVACIAGIRPNFIKLAPIIKEFQHSKLKLTLIHTGQHYDYEMSRQFFLELGLPDPDVNLEVGAGSQAYQVAETMIRLEKRLEANRPSFVIVAGDGNPTLGAALAASKLRIPVCHLEAGLRSYDYEMPEELNRRVTDHVSTILIAPTEIATTNLRQEGFRRERILRAGDTMVDVLNISRNKIEHSTILDELYLKERTYGVITLHRAENVDDPQRLGNIVTALTKLNRHVIFPVHPRTLSRLKRTNLETMLKKSGKITLTKPLGYFDMIRLMSKSRVVMTDSGGIQKEVFQLGVPCITLRNSTEWIETVLLGRNVLVGDNRSRIVKAFEDAWNRKSPKKATPTTSPYGEGGAAKKIVSTLIKLFNAGKLEVPKTDFLETGMPIPFTAKAPVAALGRSKEDTAGVPRNSPYFDALRKAPTDDALIVGRRWLRLK